MSSAAELLRRPGSRPRIARITWSPTHRNGNAPPTEPLRPQSTPLQRPGSRNIDETRAAPYHSQTTAFAARFAGVAYILIIVLGVSQAVFVAAAFEVPGDAAANIAARSGLFRAGIVIDVVLYVLVLLLSVALYSLVRGVNRHIAVAALLLRGAEGVVGLVITVLGGLLPLLLLQSAPPSSAAGVEGLVGSLIQLRAAGLDVVLILVGLGGAGFGYLFLAGRMVPSGLAIWAVLTYASMLCTGAARLLRLGFPEEVVTLLYAQGALFEVLFGSWLAFRGVTEPTSPSASETSSR
jgi:hypothetical protein